MVSFLSSSMTRSAIAAIALPTAAVFDSRDELPAPSRSNCIGIASDSSSAGDMAVGTKY